MKKKYLTSLMVITLIIVNSQLISQINYTQNISDSTFNNPIPCGLSTKYLKKHIIGHPSYNPKTSPSSFPLSAILSCGKFDVYYEDLIPSNPQVGFADPAFGTERRNTLCAVLTYVQSVFDFSNVPVGSQIKLHVNESYAPIVNPSPAGENYLAFGSPTFTNIGPSQIINGVIHEYITTGIDPSGVNNYHAELLVNFDQISSWSGSIPWQNNHTLPISNCKYDLYSVLLHEIGHTMGWLSLIEHTNQVSYTGPPVSTFGSNQFSGIDASLCVSSNLYPLTLQPLIVNAQSSPSINPLFASSTTVLTNNEVWINNLAAPNNDPVYSGNLVNLSGWDISVPSLLSHLCTSSN